MPEDPTGGRTKDELVAEARRAMEAHQWDAALPALEEITARWPESVSAWYNKAVALAWLKRTEEATAAVGRALELRPDHAEAQTLRDRLARAAETVVPTEAEHDEEPEAETEPATKRLRDAESRREAGDFAAAVGLAKAADRMRPSDPSIQLFIGETYYRMGDMGRAKEFLQKAVDLEPGLDEAWVLMERIDSGQPPPEPTPPPPAETAPEPAPPAADLPPCRNHPDRPAKGRCMACKGFFCADCLTQVEGKFYCAACAASRSPVTDARLVAAAAKPTPPTGPTPPPGTPPGPPGVPLPPTPTAATPPSRSKPPISPLPIVALVCGVVGVLFCCCSSLVGALPAIAAVVCGVLGFRAVPKEAGIEVNKVLSLIGIALGGLVLLLVVVGLLGCLGAMGTPLLGRRHGF